MRDAPPKLNPTEAPLAGPGSPEAARMHEGLPRPERLHGTTYKIKPPVSDHAMYVTINDIVLNEGTPQERRRPFEIFINSKNLDHYQWIVALTRVMSAVLRKGGEAAFLVGELKAVFDPRGGYWRSDGRGYAPSIIAELGDVVGQHFERIGFTEPKKEAFPEGGADPGEEEEAEAARQADAFAGGGFG